MSDAKPGKGKLLRLGWILAALVVAVFVGARLLHRGGVRGLLGDYFTESSSSPRVHALRERMLTALRPMGAAAICIEEVGENAELRESLASFAKRNEVMMKELVAAIEAEGGMSRREKDLVDRQAYREARRFLDQAGDMSGTCSGLAKRFNAGEFDLR